MGILSFLFPPDPPTQEAPWKLIKDSCTYYEGIPSSYTVIDLETSGLDPRHSEILEIGAIKYRDRTEIGRYHTFVRPVGRIPSSASSVNGLTWRKLHSEPLLDDVQEAFFSFIGDDVLVGHNIGFDITFVQTRFGVNLENKCFDTLKWSRLAFSNLQSYKLDFLRTYFTLGGTAHTALGDCIATHKLLERIRNAGIKAQTRDSDQGSRRPANNALYEKARQYWQKGEDERKNGNYDRAIELFDYARSLGLHSPFIYESYAMVYRKLKDYEKEISILDEGIACLSSDETEFLQVRRNRAETLWTAQKNRELELQEKAQKRELRAIKKQEEDALRAENPKRAAKRPVHQCDEEGHVIKEFESVTAAAIECKISTKSIRAAANGLQKHAGGFCWKYAD